MVGGPGQTTSLCPSTSLPPIRNFCPTCLQVRRDFFPSILLGSSTPMWKPVACQNSRKSCTSQSAGGGPCRQRLGRSNPTEPCGQMLHLNRTMTSRTPSRRDLHGEAPAGCFNKREWATHLGEGTFASSLRERVARWCAGATQTLAQRTTSSFCWMVGPRRRVPIRSDCGTNRRDRRRQRLTGPAGHATPGFVLLYCTPARRGWEPVRPGVRRSCQGPHACSRCVSMGGRDACPAASSGSPRSRRAGGLWWDL